MTTPFFIENRQICRICHVVRPQCEVLHADLCRCQGLVHRNCHEGQLVLNDKKDNFVKRYFCKTARCPICKAKYRPSNSSNQSFRERGIAALRNQFNCLGITVAIFCAILICIALGFLFWFLLSLIFGGVFWKIFFIFWIMLVLAFCIPDLVACCCICGVAFFQSWRRRLMKKMKNNRVGGVIENCEQNNQKLGEVEEKVEVEMVPSQNAPTIETIQVEPANEAPTL